MKTILNLAWKEILQLFRDRLLLFFMITIATVQLVLIAEATGAGIRGIKLAVWDQDQSPLSQELITTLDNSEEFILTFRAQSYGEIQDLMNQGRAGAALMIPPDFSRSVTRPDTRVTLAAIVDGTNAIVASSVLGVIEGAIGDFIAQLAAQSPSQPGGIDVKVETAFNPTLNIRWSSLTAQLPFILYQIVLVVAAVGFVRERELGTMEQLIVTPISRLDLMLGKGLMALLVGIVNFFLLILVIKEGFQIPLRGDVTSFALIGLVFIVTEIGVGTLISVITTTQQQAILIVFLLAMLEMSLSGFLVPTENMPAFMQFFASLSPLQHFTAISRAVFLKGATLLMMLNHVIPMLLLAVGNIVTAWALFRRAEV